MPLDEVAVLFERIVRDLMERGADRKEAEADAVPVLRARLANDHRLVAPRLRVGVCALCGDPEGQANALLAVLTGKPDSHVWLHAGKCHAEYRQAVSAKVDGLIGAAIGGVPQTARTALKGR